MNKKYLLLIAMVGLLSFSCKEDPASKVNKDNLELAKKRDNDLKYNSPIMKFEVTEHDFGTINEGDVVETVFKFKNTGKSELIVSKAKASCGCTIPQWPKKPVMPGEEAEIRVKFNSRGKPNRQQKQITLTTNTTKGKEILIIKAFVNPMKK
ncbi:MAG: hypothetical protein DSY82_05390 [Flavobacteriia bacterium]|nr:MAG: hypothetical protein DSY82_05390 [Flavobacteriia bacterium]